MGAAGVAQAEKPFYQGKTITLMTSGSPGGGTDLTARLIATILPKYLPGKPRIVLRNKPGGGGSVGLNPFYVRIKPDGLTLMVTGSGSIGLQFMKAKVVRYDLNKMRYIGNASHGGDLIVISKEGMKRLKDPQAEPVVCGSKGGTEEWAILSMFGREFLGWNLRWILGFKGAGALELAFRQGEIDMFGDSSMIKRLEADGKGIGLAQNGTLKNGKFIRRADFSHVPTLEELVQKAGKKPTNVAWKAYVASVAPLSVYKLFIAPPGTPDPIVNTLVAAYKKASKDPKFVSTWKKLVSPVLEVRTGKETGDILASILDVEPAVVAYAEDMKHRFGIIK
jgi:tripartite-type tricarboxylate transporter receptor subunit TctC